MARFDRATVNEDGRDIHTRNRDHCARHVFVAATDSQQAVNALRLAHRLNRVSNNLARDKAIFHPLGAHRDAIADSDRSKDLRHRAGIAKGAKGAVGQIVQPHVAGRNSAVAIRHTDDRFFKVSITETHRSQHGAIGSTLGSGSDQAASMIVAHFSFSTLLSDEYRTYRTY